MTIAAIERQGDEINEKEIFLLTRDSSCGSRKAPEPKMWEYITGRRRIPERG